MGTKSPKKKCLLLALLSTCLFSGVQKSSVVAWRVFSELHRYADTPISGLGGYRCGADTPISGSGGISVRRRYADIRVWGDIGAAPTRRYPGLGGYRCGADTPISRAGGISVYRCIGAAQIWNPRCRHNADKFKVTLNQKALWKIATWRAMSRSSKSGRGQRNRPSICILYALG